MSEARAFAFRERALQAHKKAMRAGIPEETRRAWLIVERDWTRMAEREELNDAMSWLDGAARTPCGMGSRTNAGAVCPEGVQAGLVAEQTGDSEYPRLSLLDPACRLRATD